MDLQLDCVVFWDVTARRMGSPMRAHRLRCLWQWPRPSATDFAGQAGVIDGDTPEIHGARIRLGGTTTASTIAVGGRPPTVDHNVKPSVQRPSPADTLRDSACWSPPPRC